MKLIQLTALIVLFICTIACANNTHTENIKADTINPAAVSINTGATDTFEKGRVVSPVVCQNDATQSYALYIPAKGNTEASPVVYFFDPHGNGSLPLNKYKALADRYGFILVGSNNSKNGNDWSTTENTWRSLADDTKKRLKVNTDRIYACGFSGGAKVASYVGLNHNEVKAVIANGAGLPEMVKANLHFSFTAVAGEGDMNMTDLVSIDNSLDKVKTRHRIIFFDGKHEWATENAMNIAFEGLQFDAMYTKQIPLDNSFISNYIIESKKTIAVYSEKHNYIKAEAECVLTINLLDGLTDEVNWFKEKDAALKNNQAYKKQLLEKQNLLATEQNLKAQYNEQFEHGDMSYWTRTIHDLQANAKAQTAEGAMYQRLIAYLSLAFYSISNQFITTNMNQQARYFVELYKMDDPGNSEAWYFSAVINARNNNAKATEDDLLAAIANGFADRERMMQQPEFKNLPIHITEIAGKIN